MNKNQTQNFYIPSNFQELKKGCGPKITLDVVAPSQCQDLIGTIHEPIRTHLDPAWLFEIGLPLENARALSLIGRDGQEARNSSLIQKLDFDARKALTKSGNIYGFDKIHTENPDEILSHLLVMLSSWGLADLAGIPQFFYED
ncbi:hypothetical protein [Curvivirga sp.]|uniref:hypothetical protein n=1 Tax=Curvivirga sp. TaxID=2856848 RepID=UPI003B5B02DC